MASLAAYAGPLRHRISRLHVGEDFLYGFKPALTGRGAQPSRAPALPLRYRPGRSGPRQELLCRYLNRDDLLKPLVSVLKV